MISSSTRISNGALSASKRETAMTAPCVRTITRKVHGYRFRGWKRVAALVSHVIVSPFHFSATCYQLIHITPYVDWAAARAGSCSPCCASGLYTCLSRSACEFLILRALRLVCHPRARLFLILYATEFCLFACRLRLVPAARWAGLHLPDSNWWRVNRRSASSSGPRAACVHPSSTLQA
jgi:hypothetical protein